MENLPALPFLPTSPTPASYPYAGADSEISEPVADSPTVGSGLLVAKSPGVKISRAGTTHVGRPRRNRVHEILALADLGLSRVQISDMTGLKRRTIREYLYEIRKSRSVSRSVSKTPRKCSSCGGAEFAFDRENGEIVCRGCGLVAEQVQVQSQDLPFGESYALTSSIAFGRSLGQTLNW